jgi:hypothetical protein
LKSIIPIEYYSLVFFITLLFIGLTPSFLTSNSNEKVKGISFWGFFLLFFTVLYIGLRPLSYLFGDMVMYNIHLKELFYSNKLSRSFEFGFEALLRFFSTFKNATFFFFGCTFIYTLPLYLASKKLFGNLWFYSFLALVASFSFWAYGVNGIRNGISTSLFIYALSLKKEYWKIIFFLLAYSMHSSILLVIAAYYLVKFIKNTRYFFFFWLISIPVSFVSGDFFKNLFLGFNLFEDNRVEIYFDDFEKLNELTKLDTSFRLDFIIYSAIPILVAYYFIYIKKLNDTYYSSIVRMYLMLNAFWILIIKVNFSNRFAYLSWFMMGLVIFYPFLKYSVFKRQQVVLNVFTFLYVVIGFVLNVFVANK